MRKLFLAILLLVPVVAWGQYLPPPFQLVTARVTTGTAVNANLPSSTVYAVPSGAGGLYRISVYAVETAADAASSTLPNVGIGWTDNDTSTALQASTVTPTNTANAVGAFGQGVQIINAKAGTNITYLTSNYASGTAGAMTYAVRIRVEYLQ
jgi:hypothetical protein